MLKKIALAFGILCLAAFTIIIWAQNIEEVPKEKMDTIMNGWVQRGLYYVFDNRGIMKAVKISGDPVGFRQFQYTTFRMGVNDFVEYTYKLNGKQSVNLLLVDEVTDSTAILSSGTPFVRADSSEGMLGTWKNIKSPTTMLLTIEPETIRYSETVFEIETGSFKTIENRQGKYRREPAGRDIYKQTENGGRYHIMFEDGRTRTMLPVIYDGLMYLFDLTPTKSEFVKMDPGKVPTYRDYQAVLEKRKAVSRK